MLQVTTSRTQRLPQRFLLDAKVKQVEAEALKDVGYDGPVVIETFSDRVEAIARAAAIWRPLASDPDTLAREGLDFLRRLFAAA